MTSLFVDCPTGLAGDMLMAGLMDLGVPKEVIEKPLLSIGLDEKFQLKIEESYSLGIRGLRVDVNQLDKSPSLKSWNEIKHIILTASWKEDLKVKVIEVFTKLAEVEAYIHGKNIEDVHFHEIGAIDTLVDIVGVCAAFQYLNPFWLVPLFF